MTLTTTAPVRARLLSTPVIVLWFAALVSWASGRALSTLGTVDLMGLPMTVSIVLGAIGLGMLYHRRGFDRLTRIPAVSAIVMAIASALAAVGLLALLTIGPDRPIGIIDVQVAAVVAITTAAASASTVVLIRPYVDPMVAHVWAGIGGAGLALPFMIAGISPAAVMAGAIALGIVDRVRGARFEREVAFRTQREAEYAAEHGDRGRGIGVSGLPGMPPLLRVPRPHRPWSMRERRASIGLGIAAVLIVALAWAAGSAAAEFGLLQPGQGFSLAALGAVPLMVQTAVLCRVAGVLTQALAIASGLLVVASGAMMTAPIDVVVVGSVGVQALAVAIITGLIARRSLSLRLGPVLMLAVSAAIVWVLIVLPSGALVLAFVAVSTTFVALRRRAWA